MVRVLSCVQCIDNMQAMRETNLAAADLNLLKALDALLTRQHVTAAAKDVGLSQPAMSRALQRLRALFDDPLLLRGPGGLILSARAENLAPRVRKLLSEVAALIVSERFDPALIRKTVRIVASDYHMITIIPRFLRALKRAAPGVTVRVEPYSPDAPSRVARGEIDLIFATDDAPMPPGAHSERILEDQLVTAVRRDHPIFERPIDLAVYAALDHVVISIMRDGWTDTDALLAAQGLKRSIALTTPSFVGALAVVGASDLAVTVSGRLVSIFADQFGLAVFAPPLPKTGFVVTQVWSAHRDGDPFHTWIRGLMRDAADPKATEQVE